MEANPSEAVRNNVGGTATMLELAGSLGLTKFVLVSTDKAVRPSNIMGATKRVGELLLLEAATKYRDTTFTAVRFGNVLGSNGSVVPIFRRQMAEGRITVTHPDVTRYFMTIPEAVQLILLASLLPEASGRIAMLEMGEPVRIVELARRMIRLAGLREPDDVEIIFTGLRPGEKLHEQLTSDDETAAATTIERIRLVDSPSGAPMLSERVAKLVGASLHLSGEPVIRQELFALLEPAAAAHPAD
jgi:FlaA1/EpsC-like NDP-sugar epimerase